MYVFIFAFLSVRLILKEFELFSVVQSLKCCIITFLGAACRLLHLHTVIAPKYYLISSLSHCLYYC